MSGLGKFYGVGVGPGDPELLTIKAVKILKSADIIYVPTKTEKDKSFAYSIISEYVENSIIKPAKFPMSYNGDVLKQHREKIVNDIIEDLKNLKTVIFITIGDPMLYSTYSYILKMLKDKLPDVETETIPGISSVSMLACKSETPLVSENEKFVIYPVTHFDENEFKKIYETCDSIVLMKFPKNSKEIVEKINKFQFKNIIYMKNICKDGEEIRFDLEAKELYEEVRKYFTIVLLQK